MIPAWMDVYEPYLGALNLNAGCALNPEESNPSHMWVNLDFNPKVKPDVVHDLNVTPLPFGDNTFWCIMASHVLEHIDRDKFLPLVADFHRILIPGGVLIAVTPYGMSDDAWECPMHKQMFTENTWIYPIAETYRSESHGYGAEEGMPVRDWTQEQVIKVPYREFENDPEVEWKAAHWRNVIRELHVVLRAVK